MTLPSPPPSPAAVTHSSTSKLPKCLRLFRQEIKETSTEEGDDATLVYAQHLEQECKKKESEFVSEIAALRERVRVMEEREREVWGYVDTETMRADAAERRVEQECVNTATLKVCGHVCMSLRYVRVRVCAVYVCGGHPQQESCHARCKLDGLCMFCVLFCALMPRLLEGMLRKGEWSRSLQILPLKVCVCACELCVLFWYGDSYVQMLRRDVCNTGVRIICGCRICIHREFVGASVAKVLKRVAEVYIHTFIYTQHTYVYMYVHM